MGGGVPPSRRLLIPHFLVRFLNSVSVVFFVVLRSEPVRVAPSFAELLRGEAKARDMKITELTRIADLYIPPGVDPVKILGGRKCLKRV